MTSYAYFQKQYMPLSEAKLNIMANFMHYGTGVFEGIRANWNAEKQQLYIFRLKEHYERMLNGCKVLKINIPYTIEELCDITVEMSARSGIKENAYLRPLAYKSEEAMGVRLHNLKADFFAFIIPWGRYIDADKCKAGVSSWRRASSNCGLPLVKATGNYINSAFTKTEAVENGFDEAIILNQHGRVAEGSGENLFLVKDGKLLTPSIEENVLPGITRNSVIEVAKKELGIETIERPIERSELYMAEEAFFSGTAVHISPIAEIDHRTVGDGEIGPVTARLQTLYHNIIEGKNPAYMDWCTPVYK
jgi:branched-chain amino acid aminotransferase